MTTSNSAETAILNLIFANQNWANIGNNGGLRGSTVDGHFYISLHTADPGEAGSQNTSEATYTSYSRVQIDRTSAAWTISGNSATNVNPITFPISTGGGTNIITHFGIGTDSTGVGNLLFSGALSLPLTVVSGVGPNFIASALTVTSD